MRFCVLFALCASLYGYVEVVPDYDGYVDTMFPSTNTASYGNLGVWGKIRYVLAKHGVDIQGSPLRGDGEKIVILNVPFYAGLDRIASIPKEKKVLVVFEPPSVLPELHQDAYYSQFSKVLTWDDDLVDGDQFIKFHYPVMYPMKHNLPSFSKRKLLCMITRNKSSEHANELYSYRRAAIEAYDESGDFDLYGYGWETEPYFSYRGSVPDKYTTMMNYRFSICFENIRGIRGYVTEKIFDCFHVGTIPIYLGADNITDYVPKECFIDMRDFTSFDTLYAYLRRMNEAEYVQRKEAIRRYLLSDKARLFSEETFVNLFAKEVMDIEVSIGDKR